MVMETRYEHIALDEDRVPTIADSTMKVIELVVEQQAYGWSPEELDDDIQRRLERVEELRGGHQPSGLVERASRSRITGPRD